MKSTKAKLARFVAFNENMSLKERMEGGLSKMVNDPSTRLAIRNLNEREAARYRLAKNSCLAPLTILGTSRTCSYR